jgi:hypothetical protein
VGSNPAGSALDPGGTNISVVPIISWSDNYLGGRPVTLSIIAERIDASGGGTIGEHDGIFVRRFTHVSSHFR